MTAAVLPRSLSLLARLLAQPATLTLGARDDPLAINLPPLGPGAGGAPLDQRTIETMAALYFQAELEQAAVIPVAEVLADARFTLEVRDAGTAQQLEAFAKHSKGNWYARNLREQLFARTFGLGGGAGHQAASSINREFEPLFGQLCLALERYQQQTRFSATGGGAVARVDMALQALLRNLARRQLGNTLIAARRIQEQLQAAINLLNQPDLTRLFQAQNLWGLIANILGDDSPDLARLIERAQSGMRILSWLARHHDKSGSHRFAQQLQSETGLFMWAASWLQASGYQQPAAGHREDHRAGHHADRGQPLPGGGGGWAPGF